MSPRRPAAALALLLPLAVAGCSGSPSGGSAAGSPPSAGASAAIVQGGDPTAAADPKGTCDKPAFQGHAGLAAGSVQAYLWGPLRAGAFADGAADRQAMVKRAGQASALVVKELSTASPLIAGCPGSIILVNALATGVSLARAATKQLVAGTPNPQTLAGVNSIAGTVTVQAAKLGIKVTATPATVAQLAAG